MVVLVALVAVLAGVGALLRDEEQLPKKVPIVPTPQGYKDGGGEVPDPFAWHPDRAKDFERRAAQGTAHALYARSPGGARASALRTKRWRDLVESTAEKAGVDPDRLEALVFLESAGRPDALTPAGIEGAAGLTQILAETGQNLLGMQVDVKRSRGYTRRIARAQRRGQDERVERLEAARRRVDERFDPEKALAATGRYLALAKRRFGREDLAFVSYHMGMGNLEDVLRAYSGKTDGEIADVVGDDDLKWVKVYFDSTPVRHQRASDLLLGFGDDSSNYYWKLDAARDIMRLERDDPARLIELSRLQTAKNSAEEVLHPGADTPRFASTDELREAWDAKQIVAFPNDPRTTGLIRDPRMGELARRLDVPAGMYRGLRPEALALALYVGAQSRELAGGQGALTVTSTVRDQRYQEQLMRRNREATHNYSLHTTGWAFDVLRSYGSRRQALAFQWVLDRLQVLNVIAWVREPDAIHVTSSADARSLLPLLERIQSEP